MDEDRIAQVIAQLARTILADGVLRWAVENPLALVGIKSRGELLAQRLASEIERQQGAAKIDVGALDITMYRDDLSSARAIMIPRGTDMDFRLDGRPVILVDDVLQSGRSVRAALDAVLDFGRPRIIRLAILVDRGLREFPIAADYVGLKVDAADREQKIVVHLKPTDDEDGVYLT